MDIQKPAEAAPPALLRPTAPTPKAPPRYVAAWQDLASACRAEPGVWFTATDAPAAYGAHIKRGVPKIFAPAGSFEATMRDTYWGETGARMGTLWVRYVGNP